MISSRRIARMTRNKKAAPKLNLTSLMDVFTILVFFLMYNYSANVETLQQPRQISLPESDAEAKPRETVVIFVGKDEVLVQGVRVARVADIAANPGELAELNDSVIGTSTQAVAHSHEVTVLADKSVPFNVVKKVMATCTGQGFTRVSLAVVQKPPQTS
jgi:biopolymer transport protein ExbD